MKITFGFVLLVWLILGLSRAGAAQTPESEGKSLADIARESKAARESGSKAVVITNDSITTHDSTSEGDERHYQDGIHALFGREAYAELEAAADSARTTKERLGGGVWKLYAFYEAAANPAGSNPTGNDWARQIGTLQKWVAARPQSITARVALAEAYRSLAWEGRGTGTADTVTAAGWQAFGKEGDLAYKALVDASKLSEKCPHWYFVMLEIARDQDWSKDKTRALFESAVAFEPSYYHYYREFAFNLLPKWHGVPGETEAFAEESNRRIGGRQGAFVYFEIATVLYCMCYDKPVTPTLSWVRIREGFNEVEERYGVTPLKLNRFALLAYLYQDREMARRTLDRLNNQWEPSLWRSLQTFNSVRMWAGLPGL